MPLTALLTIALLCAGAVAQVERVDPFEEAAATIRRATRSGPDGEQHALLLSLRALKDPQMRPLFEQLAQSGEWSMRVDGILGLAETSEEMDIDPFLISRLGSSEDRSAAIRGAIQLGLIKPASIHQLLGWSDLSDVDRIVLVATLDRAGEEWDYGPVKAICNRSDATDEARGMAALTLRSHGVTEEWTKFAASFSKLSAPRRNVVLQELAKAARTYDMVSAVEPLLALSSDTTLSPMTVAIVNGTALALDRPKGLEPWKRFVERERGQAHLVRSGLQLLSHAKGLPEGSANPLRNGEPLVEAIADAIEGSASGDDAKTAAALVELIRTKNRQVTEWALRLAADLPPTPRAEVERALIQVVQSPSDPAPSLRGYLVDAAQLVETDPSAVQAAVSGTKETVEQELIILGLNDHPSEKAAEICEALRGSLSRRGEALAVLVLARSRSQLTPELLKDLGRIAAGGGDLDPSLRVQAAWLYLRHSGRLAQALAASNP